jgi:hypothetical protein
MNYSLLIIGDSKVDGDGGEVNGDGRDGDGDRGSGGTSPSRQGAGIETSVLQNSSAVVAEMRNSSGNFVDSLRVFHPEASYRRRGIVRGGHRPPHT